MTSIIGSFVFDRFVSNFKRKEFPVGPVEMWERLAAFWRGFSKQRWKSVLFADFHGCGISIRPLLGVKDPELIFASFPRSTGFDADR
jgi:hypothetical protein